MQEVEERALEKLLASFKRDLLYHIDMEHEANKNGYIMCRFAICPPCCGRRRCSNSNRHKF